MRHFSDDEQYSEQLLDKSTEIWTGAVKKRQQVMQSLTPSYSRKYQMDNTNQSFSGIMDKQLQSIKQKLNTQKSASKQKDLEIQNLNLKISQLNKDKKILLSQIGVIEQESPAKRQQIYEYSINFERTQQNLKTQHSRHTKGHKSHIEESIQEVSNEKLENLPKEKLLELLGSTSQYRAFIEYQDSYELMFLKELHESSKRVTKAEKRGNEQWSQAQIQNQMMKLNQKQNLGTSYHSQNAILAKIRQYYEKQFDIKARNIKNQYDIKLKRTIKESSIIPEDLKQICKIKQGQLAKQMTRKKGKSLKKNR